MRFNIGALSGIIEIMKKGIISILLLIVITLTVRADYKVFEKVDPASIWNRDELYKTPKTWKYEGFLKSDVKSIWIDDLTVAFDANGRKPVKAFLLWTNDGKNVKWTEREWQEKNIADFDPASGVVTVKIPNGAYQAFVNIVADDSFIASSRIITVVQDNAANGN